MQIMKTIMTSVGKKTIAVLLGLLFAVSLCACGKDKAADKKNTSSGSSVTSEYAENSSSEEKQESGTPEKSNTENKTNKTDKTKGTKPSNSGSDLPSDTSVGVEIDNGSGNSGPSESKDSGSQGGETSSGEWLGPY